MIAEKVSNLHHFWRLFDFLKPKLIPVFRCHAGRGGHLFAAERMFTGYIVKMFTDAIASRDLSPAVEDACCTGGCLPWA